MPIQFPDIQRISFDEANPWLVGAERGQKFVQNAMQFPIDLQGKMLANQIAQAQAKYAEPTAQATLKGLQQGNEWNPKIWQSNIALQQAQQAKTEKQAAWYNQEAQARVALEQSQTGQNNALSGMNQLKLQWLSHKLGQGMSQNGTDQSGNQTALSPSSYYQPQQSSTSGGQQPSQASIPSSSNAPSSGQTQAPSNNQLPLNSVGNVSNGVGNQSSDAQNQQSNTVYGIPTPKPNIDDVMNKSVWGIDTFKQRSDNAKAQQEDQYKQYQTKLSEVDNAVNAALQAKSSMAVFNNAMNNTGMKGHFWGTSQTKGWTTLNPFRSNDSISNAQIADTAAATLLPGKIAQLTKVMGRQNFSNIDMNASSQMNVNRAMDDGPRTSATQWFNDVYERMNEEAKFYTVMGNPQKGTMKHIAEMLWAQYQDNFPLVNGRDKSYTGAKRDAPNSSLGNWPLFTTPKAIASIQATGMYKPSQAEKNIYMMKYTDGNIYPVKRGGVEKAFRQGARPL